MIVPLWLHFVVSFVMTALVIYFLSKKVKLENVRTILVLLTIGTLLLLGLTTSFLTTFAIIEVTDTGYSQKRVSFIGTPTIKLMDGSVIETKQMELTTGENYILNNTTEMMVIYPTVYGPAGYTDKMTLPDPIYLLAGTFKNVESFPDYWFEDAPSNIKVEENIFDSLFKSDKERCVVKWVVCPYSLR